CIRKFDRRAHASKKPKGKFDRAQTSKKPRGAGGNYCYPCLYLNPHLAMIALHDKICSASSDRQDIHMLGFSQKRWKRLRSAWKQFNSASLFAFLTQCCSPAAESDVAYGTRS